MGVPPPLLTSITWSRRIADLIAQGLAVHPQAELVLAGHGARRQGEPKAHVILLDLALPLQPG